MLTYCQMFTGHLSPKILLESTCPMGINICFSKWANSYFFISSSIWFFIQSDLRLDLHFFMPVNTLLQEVTSHCHSSLETLQCLFYQNMHKILSHAFVLLRNPYWVCQILLHKKVCWNEHVLTGYTFWKAISGLTPKVWVSSLLYEVREIYWPKLLDPILDASARSYLSQWLTHKLHTPPK